VRRRFRPLPAVLLSGGLVLLGFLLGYGTMVDYYGVGVLTVLVFYFFREKNLTCFLGQLVCLYILHVGILGGYYYEVTVAGLQVHLVQQGLALLALVPIWLYRGRQGFHGKAFQTFCYLFYPVHMLVLFILREMLLA